MQTKNGVVYDLSLSPFEVSWKEYTFVFSSAVHAAKFDSKLSVRIEWLTDSLSRRFHVCVDAAVIAVMQLYMQTETRGFYVVDNKAGKVHTCPENITLAGMRISGRG